MRNRAKNKTANANTDLITSLKDARFIWENMFFFSEKIMWHTTTFTSDTGVALSQHIQRPEISKIQKKTLCKHVCVCDAKINLENV